MENWNSVSLVTFQSLFCFIRGFQGCQYKKSTIFWKNTIFYQSALLYFPSAAFQSRKLLSYGLHIECFCALEIEKQSSRMTTTISGNFIIYVKKNSPWSLLSFSQTVFLFLAHRNTLYSSQKVTSYFSKPAAGKYSITLVEECYILRVGKELPNMFSWIRGGAT